MIIKMKKGAMYIFLTAEQLKIKLPEVLPLKQKKHGLPQQEQM